jgi:hypothetical protein
LLAPQPNAVARGSNGPVLTALVLAVAGATWATWAVMRAKALIAQGSPAKPWEGIRLTPSASAQVERELSDNDFARILCITLSDRYGCLRSRVLFNAIVVQFLLSTLLKVEHLKT